MSLLFLLLSDTCVVGCSVTVNEKILLLHLLSYEDNYFTAFVLHYAGQCRNVFTDHYTFRKKSVNGACDEYDPGTDGVRDCRG